MGSYVSRYWLSDSWAAPSGTYRPYVPDELCGQDITFDAVTAGMLDEASRAVQEADGMARAGADWEPLARLLLRVDAMGSSRIEGLSAPARRILELEALDADGVSHRRDSAEVLVLANIHALASSIRDASRSPLTVEALEEINGRLLAGSPGPAGGELRREQNWVGGDGMSPLGAAYVPPPHEEVPRLMDDLVRFCEASPLPALAVAGIAHAQFETIHPFTDGNGRTGRALVQIILRRRGLVERTVPPVSMVLATEREAYIRALVGWRSERDGGDSGSMRAWLRFFSGCALRSRTVSDALEDMISAITEGWNEVVRPRRGSAKEAILAALPGMPVVTVRSAVRLTGKTPQACSAAIRDLVSAGVLAQSSRNRKSGLFTAGEILDGLTALERAAASPAGDTFLHEPVRPVPQRVPKRGWKPSGELARLADRPGREADGLGSVAHGSREGER